MSVVVHDLAFQKAAERLVPRQHWAWAQAFYNRLDLLQLRHDVDSTDTHLIWDWACEMGNEQFAKEAIIVVVLAPTHIALEWETKHAPFPTPQDAVKGKLKLTWGGGYQLAVEAVMEYAVRLLGMK